VKQRRLGHGEVMAACSFCSKEIGKGTDYIFAKKDGSVFHFCSSKCRNNQLGLKRVGKKADWVKRKKPESETKRAKKKASPEKK